MRVREENCNMVLLATVTLVSAMVAVIAGWWEAPQPAAARPPVYVAEFRRLLIGRKFAWSAAPFVLTSIRAIANSTARFKLYYARHRRNPRTFRYFSTETGIYPQKLVAWPLDSATARPNPVCG